MIVDQFPDTRNATTLYRVASRNEQREAEEMTTDQANPPNRLGVNPQQIASALQDLGYRGLVDEEWPYVHSAAMGLEFRVVFHSPIEDAEEPAFESYMFDMGLYASEPVTLARVVAHCNDMNRDYRFVRFFGGQNDLGRCYVAVQMDVMADATDDHRVQRNCAMFISMAGVLRDLIRSIESEGNFEAYANHSKAVTLIKGSSDDRKLACELYWSAARQGFAGSQNNLGDLYETGNEMPQNQVMAAYWYARAAERGEPTAYLSLATLLASVADDNWTFIEAAKFAHLAVERLHEGSNKAAAQAALDRLVTLLPEGMIDAAKASADQWEPLFQETQLMSDPPGDGTQNAIRLN